MRPVGVLRKAVMVLSGFTVCYVALLRPRHLRWGASEDEVARRWPGDELVPAPFARAVRAVTIQASASRVWRWIMQVGRDRGGFYSYTVLENLIGADIHNVERLIPGLADRQPGDIVWMGPPERFGGDVLMVVHSVVPERAMVLLSRRDAERAGRGAPRRNAASLSTETLIASPGNSRAICSRTASSFSGLTCTTRS